MKKRIILLISLLCFLITGCNEEKEKLVLATEASFAPFEYYQENNIVGVDIDIAREIAKELGMELEIKDVYFDSIINEVKTGKSDIGAAGISYTEERSREVNFTINYMDAKQVLVIRKNSNIKKIDDLFKKKIAVQLGTVADDYLTSNYPNIEIIREKKFLAAIEDLIDYKVDGVLMDEIPAKELLNDNLMILDEPLVVDHYGMVISKNNQELLDVCNKVITRLKEEGKIDEMLLSHMGITTKKDNKSLYDKFYDSIIYDSRYIFILEGLRNTLIIAIGAVILGVIIGTTMAIIRNVHDTKGKFKILNYLARTYITVIRGTPSILQLMIIYYVIFKTSNVSIILVGILSFGINSGAYVAEIVRGGINSVSEGQKEAGFALGLSYLQVMKHIVIPNALRNILPALGNEFITLVKETSVGAYIGIVELTKASDIIASRTYDYFFPLMIIALIYLCITLVLTKIFAKIEKRLNHVRN